MAKDGVSRTIALVVLVALVTATGLRGAQAKRAIALTALHSRVSQLVNEGKYAEAVAIAERYVTFARSCGRPCCGYI
jgi:hypothetical protein